MRFNTRKHKNGESTFVIPPQSSWSTHRKSYLFSSHPMNPPAEDVPIQLLNMHAILGTGCPCFFPQRSGTRIWSLAQCLGRQAAVRGCPGRPARLPECAGERGMHQGRFSLYISLQNKAVPSPYCQALVAALLLNGAVYSRYPSKPANCKWSQRRKPPSPVSQLWSQNSQTLRRSSWRHDILAQTILRRKVWTALQ